MHVRNVDVDRDIAVTRWIDLRQVAEGEACPECGEPLSVWKGIEVGHIFKLGTKFSEAFGAVVQDEQGSEPPDRDGVVRDRVGEGDGGGGGVVATTTAGSCGRWRWPHTRWW